MTPKEKAIEIYNRYANELTLLQDVRSTTNEYAKKCALISIDYMYESCASALAAMGLPDKQCEDIEIEYLEDVKKEIEKL